MGNLTRAAYANQRMTLVLKVRQTNEKRNTVIALRGAIHVACFIIHVSQGRLAMPQNRRGCHETRHIVFPESVASLV